MKKMPSDFPTKKKNQTNLSGEKIPTSDHRFDKAMQH